MGWYTTGPGTLEYKYGDVVALTRQARLGQLTLVPRLLAEDEEGNYYEELEFLGPLQAAIEARGLPWQHVELDLEADPSGESVPLPFDVDPWLVLDELAGIVAAHRDSILAVIADTDEQFGELSRLGVSAEFGWSVDRSEWPALCSWLNQGLAGAPISREALRQGVIDEYDWYQPPEHLRAALEQLQDDGVRHLAVHGLAHAVLAGEPRLQLFQPDDDYQIEVWPQNEAGEPVMILFRPADLPLLDRVAQALDAPPALRQNVFYLHSSELEVDLPPEDAIEDADLAAGMRLVRFLCRQVLPAMPPVRELIPELEADLTCGWHPNASREELAAAARDAALEPRALHIALAGANPIPLECSAAERIAALAERADDPEHRALAMHLLSGAPPPDATPAAVGSFVGVLLCVLAPSGQLPEECASRFDALLGRILGPS